MLRFYLIIAGICLLSIVGLRSHYRTDPYWIYFVKSESNFENKLYRVSPEGDIDVIANIPASGVFLTDISPDGKWLLITINTQFRTQVYRLRMDGNLLANLTPDPKSGSCGHFANDGKSIIYESNEVIHSLVLASGEDITLGKRPWLSNCNVYWDVHDDGVILAIEDLYRLSLDGTERIKLSQKDLQYPKISPNGHWVLLQDKNLGGLYLISSDGAFEYDLTEFTQGSFAFASSISPDGQWVVARIFNNSQLIPIHIQNKEIEVFPAINGYSSFMIFDSKLLISLQVDGIYRSSINGSNMIQIAQVKYAIEIKGASPDGKWVFIASEDEDSLFMVPVSGGKPIRIANIGYPENEIYIQSMRGNPWHRDYLVILAGGIIMLGIFRPFRRNAII
jgi:Tol biopolymer transport system component